jgi:hypothetical protein
MTIETADTINTTRVQTGQVAGSIDPVDIQTIVNSALGMPISRTITASGTAALTDRGSLVEINLASTANTLTIPTNASVAFDIGTVIGLRQMNTGISSFATAGTPTLRTPTGTLSCRSQYSMIFAQKRATDEWVIYGDLT